MFDFPHFVASTQRRSKMTSFRVPTSHVHGKSSADLKYPEEGFKNVKKRDSNVKVQTW